MCHVRAEARDNAQPIGNATLSPKAVRFGVLGPGPRWRDVGQRPATPTGNAQHAGTGDDDLRLLGRIDTLPPMANTTTQTAPPIHSRVTEMLGVRYPIVQAPMGGMARAQLASAVSNAGGLGIIETSSGELDTCLAEIEKMKELTKKPFGVNRSEE